MANERIPDINFEGAKLWYRNFAGTEKQFNRAGDRNFEVRFEDLDLAQALINDGWNVKIVTPEEDGGRPAYAKLKVTVDLERRPSRIFQVDGDELIPLGPEGIAALDYAEIENIDIIIRPRVWEAAGRTGIKAYLRTAYVTLEHDAFYEKYGNCRVRR